MSDDGHAGNDARPDRQNTLARYRHIEKRLKRQKHRRWGARLFALAGFLLLAGGLSIGAWRNYSQQQEVKAIAKQQRDFVPTVRVATVAASPSTVSVTLPGTTAAFTAANIYARATGYIAKRTVDIGDRVKAGDLLAQLAVPELDAQIAQNEATLNQLRSALEQAEANRDLAQVTWGRDEPLVNKGWVTKQQGSVDVQTVKAQEAAVAVAQHNVTAQENLVKQLRQQRDYEISALWCRAMPPAAPLCLRSCRKTSFASLSTCHRMRPSACRPASMPSCACPNFRIASFPAR
jgi:multidrug efflux pump subunit AcrA (membrane-fusion protein)